MEELAEQGQDLGQLVKDLVEHLRQLLLVQHVGQVPDSLPVTEEHAERLREQANQLPEPTVLRLIDLLAVAIDDDRQGGDPRLPLELALVKVTRPHADLSRESLAHRVELIEARVHPGTTLQPAGPRPAVPPTPAATATREPATATDAAEGVDVATRDSRSSGPPAGCGEGDDRPSAPAQTHELTLETLRDSWTRSVLPALRERSIPTATLLEGATPSALTTDAVTLSVRARRGVPPQPARRSRRRTRWCAMPSTR